MYILCLKGFRYDDFNEFLGRNWLDLDVTIILLLFPHQVIRIEHLSPPNGLLGLISSSSSTAFHLGLDKLILFKILKRVIFQAVSIRSIQADKIRIFYYLHRTITVAQSLASYFRDPGKFSVLDQYFYNWQQPASLLQGIHCCLEFQTSSIILCLIFSSSMELIFEG